MKTLFNLTDSRYDLERFASRKDLEDLLEGFDGIELMHMEEDTRGIISPDMVVGYHMTMPEYWLDFWRGDLARCEAEFVTLENAFQHYHGDTPEALVKMIRTAFQKAISYGAEYAVLHVSEAGIWEEITGRYHYSDPEVIDGFCELVNAAIPGNFASDTRPWLLLENLWQPGLNLRNPEITARLMESIHYPKKGIVLDTGHLMHTNLSLRSQKEAVRFIHQRLDEHGELCQFIKAVHLHQSLTGQAMRNFMKHPPIPAPTYEERFGQLFNYVFAVDRHQPFVGEGVRELVARINPFYLVYEFISRDLEEHKKMLRRQQAVFR